MEKFKDAETMAEEASKEELVRHLGAHNVPQRSWQDTEEEVLSPSDNSALILLSWLFGSNISHVHGLVQCLQFLKSSCIIISSMPTLCLRSGLLEPVVTANRSCRYDHRQVIGQPKCSI